MKKRIIPRSPVITNPPATMEQDRKGLAKYDVELQEIYLFPESEHDELIRETALEWNISEAQARADFLAQRRMGEWLRRFWARMLVPTAPTFDEATPIIARVRHGCATDREFDWLGLRLALAVQLDDHQFLKLAVKLATKPLVIKAPHLMSIAMFDFFEDHDRFPSFTEFRDYVQNATGEKAIKYETLSEDNWTRHLRSSGVRMLFQIDDD
jgi:hypothetical protein